MRKIEKKKDKKKIVLIAMGIVIPPVGLLMLAFICLKKVFKKDEEE